MPPRPEDTNDSGSDKSFQPADDRSAALAIENQTGRPPVDLSRQTSELDRICPLSITDPLAAKKVGADSVRNEPLPISSGELKDLFRQKGRGLAVQELDKLDKSFDEIMSKSNNGKIDFTDAQSASLANIMVRTGMFLHKAAELYPDKAKHLNAVAEDNMRTAHTEMARRHGLNTPETLPSTKALHDLLNSLPAKDAGELAELREHMQQAVLMNKVINFITHPVPEGQPPLMDDSVMDATKHMNLVGGVPAVQDFFKAVNARLKKEYIVPVSETQYLVNPKTVPLSNSFMISSAKDRTDFLPAKQ